MQKVSVIFWEMELSYLSQKKNVFLIFWEIELSSTILKFFPGK